MIWAARSPRAERKPSERKWAPAWEVRSPARTERIRRTPSSILAACPVQGRPCHRCTTAGLEAPTARRAGRRPSTATDAMPMAIATGSRRSIASGPTVIVGRSVEVATAPASANASKWSISPNQISGYPSRDALAATSRASSGGRSSQKGRTAPPGNRRPTYRNRS